MSMPATCAMTAPGIADEPTADPSHPAAAAGRRAVAVRRTPARGHHRAAVGGVGLHAGHPGGVDPAGGPRPRGFGAGLPAWRLAGAHRHRADGRPALGDDGAHHVVAGRGLPAARMFRLGPARTALPCPVPARSEERRVWTE